MELAIVVLFGFPVLVGMPSGAIGICIGVHDSRPHFLPSDIYFEKRKYKNWSARHGWPRASRLFYECGICHKSLPSETTCAKQCGCGNLFVGPEHVGAGDSAKVMLCEE